MRAVQPKASSDRMMCSSRDSRSRTRSLVGPPTKFPEIALSPPHRALTTLAGLVSNVSANLLDVPVSGVLGLAFQNLASSGAKPLWQSLVAQPGTLDSPVMAFHLTRFINGSGVSDIEPGGSFTLGAVNHSLFNGDIDFQPVDGDTAYWTIELGCEFCRTNYS